MMKSSVMNQLRKGHTFSVSLAFLLALSLTMTSCDKRKNIHQVVKEIAEAPVDTIGFVERLVHTNPFATVDIDCFADVTYHQTPMGSDHRVVLKALPKVLDNVEVSVEDGDLVVGVDRRYRMPDKAVAVVDIYAPYVSTFTLDGGKCLRLGKVAMTSPLELILHGNVGAFTADSLTAHELTIVLEGSGSYDLKNLNTGDLRAKMTGAGSITLAGKCRSAYLAVKNGGHIDATKLVSENEMQHSVTGRGQVLMSKATKK